MVSEHLREGAAWGKRTPAPADGGDGYGLLFRGEGFPNEGEEALRLLAQSVQWKADSSEAPFPPSFAMWPVGAGEKGILAARLLDFGRDSFGRARTMRIEAAWFDVSEPRDAARIAARYLAPSGWPAEPWSDAADIRLTSDAPANDSALLAVSRFIDKYKCVPRFLVPGHGSYIAEGFDATHEQDGVATCRDVRRADPRDSGPLPPRQPTVTGGQAMPRRRGRMFLAVLIAGMAAVIGGLAAEIRRERVRADALRAEVEETAGRQRREIVGLATRLKSAENGIRAREARLEEIGPERDELRAEQKAFEGYWSVIKDHDIKSPDHLRALLDRLDKERRRKAAGVEMLDDQ